MSALVVFGLVFHFWMCWFWCVCVFSRDCLLFFPGGITPWFCLDFVSSVLVCPWLFPAEPCAIPADPCANPAEGWIPWLERFILAAFSFFRGSFSFLSWVCCSDFCWDFVPLSLRYPCGTLRYPCGTLRYPCGTLRYPCGTPAVGWIFLLGWLFYRPFFLFFSGLFSLFWWRLFSVWVWNFGRYPCANPALSLRIPAPSLRNPALSLRTPIFGPISDPILCPGKSISRWGKIKRSRQK